MMSMIVVKAAGWRLRSSRTTSWKERNQRPGLGIHLRVQGGCGGRTGERKEERKEGRKERINKDGARSSGAAASLLCYVLAHARVCSSSLMQSSCPPHVRSHGRARTHARTPLAPVSSAVSVAFQLRPVLRTLPSFLIVFNRFDRFSFSR